MPNHTTNEVLIETNTNEEQEILALQILKNDLGIKDGQFDFNGIIPMPEEIRKGAEISIEDFVDGDEPEGYENVMGKYVPKAWDSPREVAEKLSKYCKKHNLSLDWSATHEGEEGYEQII